MKRGSCLSKLFKLILGTAVLSGIVYFIADRYFYLPGERFRHPQISDVRGIDVSHHQGKINWEDVKDDNISGDKISFVIMKGTEGVGITDKRFKRNFRNAKKQGFIRGVYHFWSYRTSPERQADYFIRNVKLKRNDLAPILDTEKYPRNYSDKKFKKNVLTWLKIVERHYGVTPIIYASHDFKMKHLNSPEFDRYPFWLAHYNVKKPIYTGKWIIWQYTERGKIDGIREYVDLDIFNGTADELESFTIK